MAKSIVGKKKTVRLNTSVNLDLTDREIDPDLTAAKAQGLLRNFVRGGAGPKWGTAFAPTALLPKGGSDTVANLQGNWKNFTVNEVGVHVVVMVYFDQAKDDKAWRFFQVQADEIQVIP